MVNDSLLQETLYQAIITRFYTGALREGDALSQRQLSEQYQLGMPVVRGALRKLAQGDYITSVQEKRAVILYNPREPAFARAILLRKYAILDAFDALSMIFSGLYASAAMLGGPQHLQRLRQVAGHLPEQMPDQENAIAVCRTFMSTLLQPLRNPLLLDLQRELQDFTCMPNLFLGEEQSLANAYLRQLPKGFSCYLERIQQRDGPGLHELFSNAYSSTKKLTEEHLNQLGGIAPEHDAAVPFEWISCKGRRLENRVALMLLRLMDNGIYAEGDLLPSVSALAQRYHISPNTARSAYAILCELGFAQTTNGVGTHVRFGKLQPGRSFTREELFHNLTLHLDALQILALSVRVVAREVFPRLGPRQIAQIEGKLRHVPNQVRFCVFPVYLTVLAEYVGCAAVRTIYGHLVEQLFWGYHLRLSEKYRCLHEADRAYRHRALEFLRAGDAEGFANELEQFALHYYAAYHRAVRALGIPAATLPARLDRLIVCN